MTATTNKTAPQGPLIALVGCGFVGSIFATEFAKLQMAGKLPDEWLLIDDDTVDSRNPANQNFSLVDVGQPKVRVVQETLDWMHLKSRVDQNRLRPDNYLHTLAGSTLVVDAVDNLKTRQLLWAYGIVTGTPILHLGLSESGEGTVSWTHHPQTLAEWGVHDTFPLSPPRTAGKEITDPESGKQPPCELVRMRSAGWLVGYTAAKAASLWRGFDPWGVLDGLEAPGWRTDWLTTHDRVVPLRESWSRYYAD